MQTGVELLSFWTKTRARLAGALMAAGVAVAASPAQAQDGVIDYRETMRQLVQSVSAYGRGLKPNLIVVAENGLGLITKPDPQDDTQLFPARALIRSIDGVLQTDLIKTLETSDPKEDPAVTAARQQLGANVETAQIMGVKVFNLEIATKAPEIDQLYAKSAAKGTVPYVAQTPMLGRIAAYPKSAYKANPVSLTDTTQAKNFLYIAQSQGFGSSRDFVQAMSNTNHDVIITSV